jgi:hypothetical protein
MARRFWPGADPVGKRLKDGLDPAANIPWTTVVGVVADMRRQKLDEPAIPYLFRPGVSAQMDIAVRTLGDPTAMPDAIRAELHALDPTTPPYGVVTVEGHLGETVALRTLRRCCSQRLLARRSSWQSSAYTASSTNPSWRGRRRSAFAWRLAPVSPRCCE